MDPKTCNLKWGYCSILCILSLVLLYQKRLLYPRIKRCFCYVLLNFSCLLCAFHSNKTVRVNTAKIMAAGQSFRAAFPASLRSCFSICASFSCKTEVKQRTCELGGQTCTASGQLRQGRTAAHHARIADAKQIFDHLPFSANGQDLFTLISPKT